MLLWLVMRDGEWVICQHSAAVFGYGLLCAYFSLFLFLFVWMAFFLDSIASLEGQVTDYFDVPLCKGECRSIYSGKVEGCSSFPWMPEFLGTYRLLSSTVQQSQLKLTLDERIWRNIVKLWNQRSKYPSSFKGLGVKHFCLLIFQTLLSLRWCIA